MLRREARLRKEFLYRKALEEKEKKLYDNKCALKDALENNRPIPVELRKEATSIAEALSFDDNLPGRKILMLSTLILSS